MDGLRAGGLRPGPAYAILDEMTDAVMLGADGVVRRMLPAAMQADGDEECAARLRSLAPLRDAGTAWSAVLALRAARARLRRQALRDAVRSCEEAACAAAAGDVRSFALHVRAAAAFLRREPGPPS